MTFVNNIKNKFINIIGIENIEFISHTKNYLSAGIFTRALSFISVPIFTRLLLPNEYGILAIFSSITSIFAILLGFNIHGAVARYYYEKSNDFAEFLGSNLLFVLFFNFFAISLIYLIKDSIANFFVIIPYLFIIAILISAFAIPCDMYLAYLQARKQSKKYSLISINKGILSLIVSIIWVYLLKENRYYGQVYSSLLITTVFAFYMIYNLVKLSKFNFKLEYIKYSIRFGVPLIPHAFSGFILAFFDRIIINQLCGSLYTGLYSFAYNVGMVMNIVAMAMNNSWWPIFYVNLRKRDFKKIDNLAYNYSKYIYFTAIGLILFSKEIVSLMAAEKYHTALTIVPVIVIGYVGLFLYTLYTNYSFYRKKTGLISLATLFVGGINIGLNYWLIPIYGYVAAAYTTLVSYFLLFLFHFLNVKYILKEKDIISIGRILLNFGWIILAVLVFIFTNSCINIFIISLILKVLFVAFIGWMLFIKDKQ